jgi:hypothetical protein
MSTKLNVLNKKKSSIIKILWNILFISDAVHLNSIKLRTILIFYDIFYFFKKISDEININY